MVKDQPEFRRDKTTWPNELVLDGLVAAACMELGFWDPRTWKAVNRSHKMPVFLMFHGDPDQFNVQALDCLWYDEGEMELHGGRLRYQEWRNKLLAIASIVYRASGSKVQFSWHCTGFHQMLGPTSRYYRYLLKNGRRLPAMQELVEWNNVGSSMRGPHPLFMGASVGTADADGAPEFAGAGAGAGEGSSADPGTCGALECAAGLFRGLDDDFLGGNWQDTGALESFCPEISPSHVHYEVKRTHGRGSPQLWRTLAWLPVAAMYLAHCMLQRGEHSLTSSAVIERWVNALVDTEVDMTTREQIAVQFGRGWCDIRVPVPPEDVIVPTRSWI
jgi:hypothetical protein